jgi:alpha-beta hydrolase superfamily lysophospholipase
MLYFILFLLVSGWVAIEFASPYAIILPPTGHQYPIPQFQAYTFEPVDFQTFDHLRIKGYYRAPEQGRPKAVIIFVHGIGGKKEHFMGSAEMLAREGFAGLVFDGRAHGKSEGKYCTYGFKEKRDIQALVKWTQERAPGAKIGIWGNSLGGAIALQALAIEPGLSFGIVQSTFTDLEQIVFDYQNRMLYGFGSRHLSNKALRKAGIIAGFDPQQVNPLAAAALIQQAVLVAHGDQDANISVEYGKSIYQALLSPQKELVIVPGADHFDLFDKGGAKLNQRFIDFLHKQCRL